MHVNSLVQIEKHSKSWNFWGDRIFTNFSKIALSKKVTTDFENRAKRQAETKACVFWTWTTSLHPTEQVQSILQSQISIHFAHFRFECKQLKNSVTRYSWEKNHSRKCYQKPFLMIQKNWKLWNYRTSRFVYAAARRNALAFSHCMQ